MGLHWTSPAWLWPLLLIMAVGAVAWAVRAYAVTRPAPPAGIGRLLVQIRSVVFVLLILAVAGPVLLLLRDDRQPAELLVVVEDSASMSIADGRPASDDPSIRSTRWTDALGLAAFLEEQFSVHDPEIEVVILRGNGLDSFREFRLSDGVIPEPAAHGTSFRGLTRMVTELSATRPVRAMVLISDGQETVGSETDPSAYGGESSGRTTPDDAVLPGPVLVAGVGDENGPADRAIRELRYPDTAYSGDEVFVEFAVDHRFAASESPGPVNVQLERPDGSVVADTVLPYLEYQDAELSFKVEGQGWHFYELSVSPLVNERFPANNRASLAVNVLKERARVLLLTPFPGWNVRFLAQAAAREPRVELAVVYPNEKGLVFADSLIAFAPEPGPEPWQAWDGVVLTGWTGALAGLDWDGLSEAVSRGLGLFVLPADHGGGGGGPLPFPPPAELAELLPVALDSWRWVRGPHFVNPVQEQGNHPLLAGVSGNLDPSPDGFRGLSDLPPLQMVVQANPRPGSTGLLNAGRQGAASGDSDRPLLVAYDSGDGRVAWFGGLHFWELAFWESPSPRESAPDREQPGRRLARNLLVWTATGEEQSGLVLKGGQMVFQEGERIRLSARWLDMRGEPVTDRDLTVSVRRLPLQPGVAEESVHTLKPSVRPVGEYEVDLPPFPPGEYQVQLSGQGDPPILGAVEKLTVSAHSVERTQVRMDRRRLQQLTGPDDLFDANEPADRQKMIDRLRDVDWSPSVEVRRSRWEFWIGWPFLVLATLLLGVEWFLRRRHGML